ncbi:MAG: guanylate kinase [Deltaproteobacteria bacterium HGW-Deltaproteobacteria-15]|jgi:guanylate kinase|nr:MAG: guanylate kinase [Deltaproteobacteria bacterium HGW-Deltaproteobacteria-15]
MSGRLYVISGPSGAGKSTIIHHVMKEIPDLGYSVSHTTRQPRENEVDGQDYHFVDKQTFQRMIREGDFLEWAQVYDDLYGTSLSGLHRRLDMNMDVILDVDVQGAGNVRRKFEDAVLTFLLPPSLEVLEKRLRNRATESENAFRNRTEKALLEIRESRDYDYIVFNDELRDGVKRVVSIILAERCRSRLLFPKAVEIFRIP